MKRRSTSGPAPTVELRPGGKKDAPGVFRAWGASSRRLVLAVLLVVACPACSNPGGESDLLVFGAASLADVLTEVGQARERDGGEPAAFNFAGSNLLARQIDAGAPAAVFVSADRAQVDWLEARGRLSPGSARPIAGNSLVVVTPRGSAASLRSASDLLTVSTLSIADPAAVPAGVHAKAWLEREGLWPQLADRVVPTLDVRAALAAVAAGNVEAGIVYATDARSTPSVAVAFKAPAATAPSVSYVAAAIGEDSARARDFLDYLADPRAQAIFEKHGFLRTNAGGRSDG